MVLYCPPHSLKPIQVTHQNHMALQVDVQSFSPVRGIYGASTTCDVVVVFVYLIYGLDAPDIIEVIEQHVNKALR